MKNALLGFLLCLGLINSACSADLMDIYRQALDNDPTFKAAYSSYMANKEAFPQALSALLPQLDLSGSMSRNRLKVRASIGTEFGNQSIGGAQLYNSNTWQVTASQTVFNYQAWANVQLAKASVKSALADFNDAAQDLILRTTSAYLDVLFARDKLDFAEAKLRANKRQLEQARQRFNVGLDTITSVYEAQSAYDQSIAEVISAKNNQINQRENLRKITNYIYDELSPLRNGRVPLIKPEPDNVNDWVTAGIKQNYKLLAAKYSLQAARENVKTQSAGNWPTFAIQGTSQRTFNSGGLGNAFVPSDQEADGVALTMSLPFYQGGLVQSQTRKAQYDFQTSSEQVEKTYRDVAINSKIAFNTIIDGISKVKADRQTVVSQKNSLESTEAQFDAGTRTMVDVTNAQQRLFEAQTQLAEDQYNFIRAVLNLKYLAGTLNVDDIMEVNAWLKTTRISSLPPQKPSKQRIQKKARPPFKKDASIQPKKAETTKK